MKNRSIVLSLFLATLLVVGFDLTTVNTANADSKPAISKAGLAKKKFSFNVNDVNNARKMSKKPQLLLSWESRVKLANKALAQDAATVKTAVDGVLARADQKAAECSTKDYTIQDLEALCKEGEGVQACLDRLMMNCFVGQASQQMANGMADALAAQTIQTTLDKLKKDITNLEQALYK
jgi:hypothetical protein